MQNNIEDFVNPVKKNGKFLTHTDFSKDRVKDYRCSTFKKKKNLLVKGEEGSKDYDKRNAMILLFDCESGNIVGESGWKAK